MQQANLARFKGSLSGNVGVASSDPASFRTLDRAPNSKCCTVLFFCSGSCRRVCPPCTTPHAPGRNLQSEMFRGFPCLSPRGESRHDNLICHTYRMPSPQEAQPGSEHLSGAAEACGFVHDRPQILKHHENRHSKRSLSGITVACLCSPESDVP